MSAAWEFLRGQFKTLPYPDEDCSGKTVVVTGANSGIGLEAAKHFVRLNASKVILGCRNLDKAASAKQVIEESTKRQGVVELWQVDLSSFDSVKEFAARVNELDRLDVFVNNASILTPRRAMVEGHESQITVNVISTLLLSILVLPTLRRLAERFNTTAHLITVASDGAFLAKLPEQKESIIQALDAEETVLERYTATKLLQLMSVEKLAEAIDASGKGHIIVNAPHPGFCKTQLFRQYWLPIRIVVRVIVAILAREPEMGSRTVLAAAFADEESHGKYMADCKVHSSPKIMTGYSGERLTGRVWGELLEIIEAVEPGVTQNI
ncbi:Fc.00g053150.m01.CDS01 [Cosmosporella sp. VM-42]